MVISVVPVTSFNAATPVGGPPHALFFVIGAFICLGVTQLPLVVRRGGSFAPYCYWAGTAGAALCVFIAAIPDWPGGLMFAGATVFAMALTAYFATNYIRIRGKIYTFHITQAAQAPRSDQLSTSPEDSPDDFPDAYGTDVTATKMWWLLVPTTGLCALTAATNVRDPEGQVWPIICTIVVALLAIGFGYLADGSWGYRIARRQYLQFVLVSVVTAGVFPVLYLPAHALGRRWPLRNRRSLELRVHNRFRHKS